MANPTPSARRKARRFALQALYQWQIAGGNITDIEAQFRAQNDMHKADLEYFHDLLHGVPGKLGAIDDALAAVLDRKFSELSQVEKAALRIGAYEMLFRIDVPYRVVINECIELVKMFGAEEGYRYINGVLDKLAREHRQVEVSAPRS